uniref:twist-related protein 1-like n=1 Tax=Gasterosteus aculeatus aculeatus TaxID=481459 RepID=UPI001A9950B5|nr:twist-related protein 1-like [Gasterosteus aculeatus aculeatus]
MAPLSSRRTAAGGGGRNALRTFRTSATSSFSDADGRRTPSALRSGASSGSTGEGNAGPGGGASRSNPLKVERDEPGGGEDESRVDDAGGGGGGEEEEEEEEDGGLVEGEPPECPGDRTQSDEGELWMGPWNSLHIPMTKL